MRKLTLSLIAGAAAVAFGGAASAQETPAQQAPQREMTRAAVEQRADQAFDRLDANRDGKLDQADREARQKIRFDRVDTNHDGEVSYAEFAAARAGFDQARKTRMAERGARSGRDGARRGEHRMAVNRFGHGFVGHRGALARVADADKDGAVSKAEFQARILQRFDRLDANHDGTVTADEAKAARDNMRQQWQSRREARDS
jgi:Ca2+-binding EF-hand superfamily protein